MGPRADERRWSDFISAFIGGCFFFPWVRIPIVSKIFLIPALALLLVTLAASPQAKKPTAEAWVALTLKSMTLDEKIGQMIMPSMEGAFTNYDSVSFRIELARVKNLGVGGSSFFAARPSTQRRCSTNCSATRRSRC